MEVYYIKFFVTLVHWFNNKVFSNPQETTEHMINVNASIKTAKFADNIEILVLELLKLAQIEYFEDLTQILRLYYLPNSSKSQKLQCLNQAIVRVSYHRMELHKNGIAFPDNFNKISGIAHELTQNIFNLTHEAKVDDDELSQFCAKYSSTNFINEMKTKLPKFCYESLILHITSYNILKADSMIPHAGVLHRDGSFKMIINYFLEYQSKQDNLNYKLQLIKNNNDLIKELSL